MNRRQIITTATASIAVLLTTNRDAIARMQATATPEEADAATFELEDFSPLEALYLGVLFTWLELLDDSLTGIQNGIDQMQDEEYSDQSKAAVLLPLGVWQHLATDCQKFGAPEIFEQTHIHVVAAFDHLGLAANIFVTGVLEESTPAVTLGTEHITMASEQIGLMVDALPFKRPNRDQILPPPSN